MKVGFLGLLTIVFVVLKLTGVLSWSWLWVLSPLWISAVIWLIVMGAIFTFVALISD